MKNNELRKELTALKNTNRMYKHVINEIILDSKDYQGTFKEQLQARVEDIQYGCSSGTVSSMIYYKDTLHFFKLYRKEIETLLTEQANECGCPIYELLKDFDQNDLFCRDTHNKNLLAWFAYEEINNMIANILEI